VEALAVIISLALVAGGVVVWLRGRSRTRGDADARALSSAPQPPAPSGVRTLKIGDVVNLDGADFIVEGTLRLEQDGFRWEEHRLVDGERSRWLSVEDDEGLEVVVWERARAGDVEPGAQQISHEGVDYELLERGSASFTAEGSTATAPSGRAEYVEYGAGERRLAFERFGDDAGWELGTGTVISEHALDIYPARERR
jgi:hypothetical protein